MSATVPDDVSAVLRLKQQVYSLKDELRALRAKEKEAVVAARRQWAQETEQLKARFFRSQAQATQAPVQ